MDRPKTLNRKIKKQPEAASMDKASLNKMDAFTRARRRKSPWNFVLILFGFIAMGIVSVFSFRLMWQLHTYFYPDHLGRFSEFWHGDVGFPAFVSSFLLLMPLLFFSMPVGMIFANCVAWCIPPVRKIFEKETEGYPGTSFLEATTALLRMAAVLAPICFGLSFIGAVTLRHLK